MLYLAIFLIISGILLFVYSAFHKSIEGDNKSGAEKRGFTFITRKKIPVGNSYDGSSRVPENIFTDDVGASPVIKKDFHDESPYHDKGHTVIHKTAAMGAAGIPGISGTTEAAGNDKAGENIILEPIVREDDNRESSDPVEIDIKRDDAGITEGDGLEGRDAAGSDDGKVYFTLYDDRSSVINYNNKGGIIDPTLEEYKKIKRIGKGEFELDREGISFHMGRKLFRFDFHKINEVLTGNNSVAIFITGSDVVKLFVAEKEPDMIGRVREKYAEFISSRA